MNSSKNNKLLYLEGLRGLAALVVVFSHLRNTFATSLSEDVLKIIITHIPIPIVPTVIHSFFNIFLDGTLAVYIFWFMSAYVISIKLFKDDGRNYLYRSFIKRYFRLAIPVLGSVLFAYVLLKMGWMYNNELAKVLGNGYENGWLGSFYDFDANIFIAIRSSIWNAFFSYSNPTYNASLWTMKPELYGSLFVFFLFGVFDIKKYRYVFYTAISLIAFSIYEYWFLSFIFGFWLSDMEHTESRYYSLLDKILQFPILNLFFLSIALFVGGQYNLGVTHYKLTQYYNLLIINNLLSFDDFI